MSREETRARHTSGNAILTTINEPAGFQGLIRHFDKDDETEGRKEKTEKKKDEKKNATTRHYL